MYVWLLFFFFRRSLKSSNNITKVVVIGVVQYNTYCVIQQNIRFMFNKFYSAVKSMSFLTKTFPFISFKIHSRTICTKSFYLFLQSEYIRIFKLFYVRKRNYFILYVGYNLYRYRSNNTFVILILMTFKISW